MCPGLIGRQPSDAPVKAAVSHMRQPRIISILAVLAILTGTATISGAQQQPTSKASVEFLGDRTSVADPKAYQERFLERFTLFEIDYCAPRTRSLEVYRSAGGPIRGAAVALDPISQTNFNEPLMRGSRANPAWENAVHIRITPSSMDWGFPGVFKHRTGRDLRDVVESEVLSSGDLKRAIQEERDKQRGDKMYQRIFLARFESGLTLVQWRASGTILVTYPISEGVVGSISVSDKYFDRLDSLVDIAHRFFRPCKDLLNGKPPSRPPHPNGAVR